MFDGQGGNGRIYIAGVIDTALGYNIGDEIDSSSGVGLYYEESSISLQITEGSVQLIPASRTQYGMAGGNGDNKTVLRAIFQFDANSYLGVNGQNNAFIIRVKHCTQGVYINKIIAKKLSDLDAGSTWDNWSTNNANSGIAEDWVITDSGGGAIAHAFDTKRVYYNSNKLVWGVDDGDISSSLDIYSWHQDFNTPTTASNITYSAGGWDLKILII